MNGGEMANKQKPWNWMLFPFSSVKTDGDAIYAASPGHGIYRSVQEGEWSNISEGISNDLVVNRLQLSQGKLIACTNDGLFTYADGEWEQSDIAIPCYQYKTSGECGFAATDYGLWHCCGGVWRKEAFSDRKVYDFLNLPQFMIIAHDQGIALYDRYVDEWSEFPLQTEVTSLAVYQGHLIGAGAGGELIVGNKKGGFDVVRFGSRLVFTLIKHGRDVYACTDKGLYRIGYLRGQITMFAVKLGFPVTDIDSCGQQLYMATLFEGIQQITLPLEHGEVP